MTGTADHSNALAIERARRVTAAEEFDIGARFPSVFASAEGSWMRDLDGKRVLDVTAASGTLLLGNQHPRVVEAVVDCVRNHGAMFASTLTPQRIELAEKLCERFPAGEKAVFCKTGSEATTAAIRLARAASGRDLILTSGYHGWHDWQLTYLNIGFDAGSRVANFGYNRTALTRLLEEFAGEVAAVIVTPEPAWLDPAYYCALSELSARHDVLFILDEVITAFRYGPCGLNGTGMVPADLITVSKGLGNGHAIASVIGRRDVIDAYDKAALAGTYACEVPPMAAALAVLDVTHDGSVHERCEQMGKLLKDGMGEVLASVGIPAYIAGPNMMFDVVVGSDQLSWDIYRAAYDHGAYFEDSGTQMISAAFGETEVEHALTAFEKGARTVAATTTLESVELPEDRKLQFTAEAFGGVMLDTDAVLRSIDETVERIAERDKSLGHALDHACG